MLEFNDKEFLEQAKHIANYFDSGVIVIWDKGDGSYPLLFMNEFLSRDLGYDEEKLLQFRGKQSAAVVYEGDRPLVDRAFERVARGEKPSVTFRLVNSANNTVWYLAHFFRIRINDKDCIAIIHTNVEDLMGSQLKLQSDNKKWQDIVESIPVGIAIFKLVDGKNSTIAVNNSMVQLANELGTLVDGKKRNWQKEELMMIFNQSIYAFCCPEDYPLVDRMMKESSKDKATEAIFRLRGSLADNPVYVYSSCISKQNKSAGVTYYVSFQNVTDEVKNADDLREKQEQLYKLSYYDALTGVKNRNAFNAFSEHCKKNRLVNAGFAFCDLNGLKKTNDSLGHIYGDQMIVSFVSTLKEYVSEDNIYRISGDEFVVVIDNISRSAFSKLMTEIIERVKELGNLASIGFMWKPNASDMKRRISQVEQIMYVEKQKYYEETGTITSKHRPVILDSLIKDLERGSFKMYLQPKSRINEKKARGAEALIRKFDANGDIVPPYEFIPQLEKERLIPKIDFFMLEEACKFLERLKSEANTEFVVSVNMSRVTLVENDYIERVSDICNRYDFNRNQLEFEITESNETMDHIRMEEYIKRIKSLGIGVSIDDAGTEYSSLPMFILDGIDWVKFDRSLIVQLNNEKARKLLAHMIIMSHDLNMKVIAEGVETDEERALLEAMDCDMYQGYYLSKPVPVEEFIEKFL